MQRQTRSAARPSRSQSLLRALLTLGVLGLSTQAAAGTYWKWYSDRVLSEQFDAYMPAVPMGDATGLQLIPADFNGDGVKDLLVFRSSDGAFWKWYSDPETSPNFAPMPVRYIGGYAGAFLNAQMIPADFNGDGRTDILVFRSSDGTFFKWYSEPGRSADFTYQQTRHLGGSSGYIRDAQLIPVDFNGDKAQDLLVFRPGDGFYAKAYSDGAVSADFQFMAGGYIGGTPGQFPQAQMIPADFNDDGRGDILVFQPSGGLYFKWYSGAAISADFTYLPMQWVTGFPGGTQGVQLIPANFDRNRYKDILAFRPSDGLYAKWYSNDAVSADFWVKPSKLLKDQIENVTNAQMIPADLNGDGLTDFMVFEPSTGTYWRWYSYDPANGGFITLQGKSIAGFPANFTGTQMIPMDFSGNGTQSILLFSPN